MALSDPQSIDPGSGAVSLPRTSSGVGVGGYTSNDGTLAMTIQHSYGTRTRRTVSAVIKKYSSDPTNSALSKPVSATARIIIDQPIQGFTVTELKTLVTGLLTNLTASTNANLIKVLGGES